MRPIGPKMAPLRPLGGLWAAKSKNERFLVDVGAHVGPMLEAMLGPKIDKMGLESDANSKPPVDVTF